MAFWAYIFETARQILMIFSQMLDIIALNDSASVLCARKFSFIIIIFKALKLTAAVFMYFF